jgi:hypothetical protein
LKDYKEVKKAVVRMYKKWVNNQEKGRLKAKEVGGDSDAHQESKKQRGHLEQSLTNVTGKLTKSYQTFDQSNKKILK